MKQIKEYLMVIVLILSLVNITNATSGNDITSNTPDEQSTKTRVFDAKTGGKLAVNVNQGNIYISTSQSNKITVRAENIVNEEWEQVNFKETSSTLEVSYKYEENWGNSIDWYFELPEKYHLSLITMGGNIKISDPMQGMIHAKTMGGNIKTDKVIGELFIKTMGGNISIGNVQGKTDISTNGGNISIANISGDHATVNTMGGRISIGNVTSSLNVKTMGGDIKIGKVSESVSAVTYGGDIEIKKSGGSVEMKTFGGDLTLGGASGKVRAETMGGDIMLKNIIGSVSAVTRSGDVEISLLPSSESITNIETNNGDVTLRIDPNSNATIMATIETWGDDDLEINSDINPTTSNILENEIVNKYVLGNGSAKVTLKAYNGEISIKNK